MCTYMCVCVSIVSVCVSSECVSVCVYVCVCVCEYSERVYMSVCMPCLADIKRQQCVTYKEASFHT